MEDVGYPEQLLDYRPIGRRKRRRPGRSLKRPLDRYNRETKQVIYWPNFVTRRRKIRGLRRRRRKEGRKKERKKEEMAIF
jgi:hypothetical protein